MNGGLYANPECQPWLVYLVCLLLLPVCSSARRIGAKKDIDHDLKDTRRGDTGRGATACGAVGATILQRRARMIGKQAQRRKSGSWQRAPGDHARTREVQWVLRRKNKVSTYADPE